MLWLCAALCLPALHTPVVETVMLRRRTIVTGLLTSSAVLIALTVGLVVDAVLVPGASAAPHAGSLATARPTTCNRPAPLTADGYTALWSSLDSHVWGGADVSVSARLADGRVLWLYGDTMSGADAQHPTGFVHSSAIVQSAGCLRVSSGGRALLPDVDRNHWYWIEDATVRGTSVTIRARLIARTGPGVWGFADSGFAAIFTAAVDATGDVRLTGRPVLQASAAPNPGAMLHVDGRPHHFGYARVVHTDIPLADGRVLVTTCQNWDGPGATAWADYRPIFSSVPLNGAPHVSRQRTTVLRISGT